MKFSHNWLQTFFAEALPAPEILAEKITFHSSEVEEIISLPKDSVLDVKVLPDKSAWLMSHRGLAKEISAILNIPLTKDPFFFKTETKASDNISIKLSTETCDFYGAALIAGVKVGPSPVWLKEALEAVGQRSINNIVDATNYVMFELGQPLHAFDADKLASSDGKYQIEVRGAKVAEKIITLTGETFELSPSDAIITDGTTENPIGIAGVKGGKQAAVEDNTTTILLEAAHFNRFAIRNTSKRLKLITDASKRYENGISAAVARIALGRVIEIILDVAGGSYLGQATAGKDEVFRPSVSCSLVKINSVLGLSLKVDDVSDIIKRFGFAWEWVDEILSVTPTFERDDIVIAEDLIEEIGRIHGLHHIVSIAPEKAQVGEFNKRHYYAEKIRTSLFELGFSEVYTSSFRDQDIVRLENALASDKGCLRSTLTGNLHEAREKNIPHRDLLGLSAVKLFEIGTVFAEDSEEFRVALAVQTGTSYKAKLDETLLSEALQAISQQLGIELVLISSHEGIAEFSLDKLLPQLPLPVAYDLVTKNEHTNYEPFSVYPAMTRDIAMWVGEGTTAQSVIETIAEAAGALLVRTTLFDEFTKEGKTSYALRLVFQSKERTLTDLEVETYMENVYQAALKQGFEVR